MVWFWFLMFLSINFVINSMIKISNRFEMYSYREIEISDKYCDILQKVDILVIVRNFAVFVIGACSFLLGVMYLGSVPFFSILWYIACVGFVIILYPLWFYFYTKKHDFMTICKKLEKRWKEEKIFSDYHEEEVKVVRGIKEGYDIGVPIIILCIFVIICFI